MSLNFSSLDFKKAKPNKNSVIICNNYRICILSKNLIRVEYNKTSSFADLPSQAIWFRNFKKPNFTFEESGKTIKIFFNEYYFCLDKENVFSSYFEFKKKKVFLSNKNNLKGTTRTLDMSPEGLVHFDNYLTGKHKEILYSDPALLFNGVCSKDGVAYFDDASSLLINESGDLIPNLDKNDLYIFFFPNDYEGAVKQLYQITGFPPMLPKFVFGNWWSRYKQYTDESYLALLDKFEQCDIPLSVATIDMDWHYVDIMNEFKIKEKNLDADIYGERHGWTGFTWNKHLFKDYKAFLKDVKSRDLNITLNLHPASGIRWFEKDYKMFANNIGIDPKNKHVVEFDFTNQKFIDTYFKMLHNYEKDGVDFWWIDWQQGVNSKIKGYDPLWGLNHFQYQDINREKRGIILSRYSGIGSHRYPLGFSGDTIQTFDVLKFVIYFTATSSNIGYTFWSHDIGGHHAGKRDPELYIRWLQFALYNPILRLHSYNSETGGKEPWDFPSETFVLARNILQERNKLVPYLYSLAYKNTSKGECFIRPLYYLYPNDSQVFKYKWQYLLGNILVCPIYEKIEDESRLLKKEIYLPEGKWFSLNSLNEYIGKSKYNFYYSLGDVPTFIKDGSIIYSNHEYKNLNNPSSFDVSVTPSSGEVSIFEDDGISFKYKNGDYLITTISHKMSDNNHILSLSSKGNDKLCPNKRTFYFKLIHQHVDHISCNEKFKLIHYELYDLLIVEHDCSNELIVKYHSNQSKIDIIKSSITSSLLKTSFYNDECDALIKNIFKQNNVAKINDLIKKSNLMDFQKEMLLNIIKN